MKKVIFITIVLTLILSCSIAFADIGDVIGYVYATDIVTYINGKEVPSCNIGNQMAIPIELITNDYVYDEEMRTLIIKSFDPQYMKDYINAPYPDPIGTIIANIYETDIKVYMYDKIIPSYNIGGITCVSVESLGLDNAFSDIGGKITWDPDNRVLNLEFMYRRSPANLLNKQSIIIEDTEAYFSKDIESYGGVSVHFSKPSHKNGRRFIIPVNYKQTQIGYVLKTPTKLYYVNGAGKGYLQDSTAIIPYLYEDIVEEVAPAVHEGPRSLGDIIDLHLEKWMGTIEDRYTGDSYILLRIKQATVRGSNDMLLYVRTDGTYEYIHNMLPETDAPTRVFTRFIINPKNETVSIRLRGSDRDYLFDMKNCEMITL